MEPFHGGGEMIASVADTERGSLSPHRIASRRAPAISQSIGLGAAADYLDGIGRSRILITTAPLRGRRWLCSRTSRAFASSARAMSVPGSSSFVLDHPPRPRRREHGRLRRWPFAAAITARSLLRKLGVPASLPRELLLLQHAGGSRAHGEILHARSTPFFA